MLSDLTCSNHPTGKDAQPTMLHPPRYNTYHRRRGFLSRAAETGEDQQNSKQVW
jgi:hypothetical protein